MKHEPSIHRAENIADAGHGGSLLSDLQGPVAAGDLRRGGQRGEDS